MSISLRVWLALRSEKICCLKCPSSSKSTESSKFRTTVSSILTPSYSLTSWMISAIKFLRLCALCFSTRASIPASWADGAPIFCDRYRAYLMSVAMLRSSLDASFKLRRIKSRISSMDTSSSDFHTIWESSSTA